MPGAVQERGGPGCEQEVHEMAKLRKVLDKLTTIEKYVCCVLLVLMLIVCFASVIMRYVFNSPFSWSEEVILVFLVWFGFLCMSVDVLTDSHIAITGVYAHFPPAVQKVCDVLRHLLLIVFFFLMAKDGWQIFLINCKKRLPASQWSQGLQFFPMVLGGTLMCLFSLVNLIGVFVKEKSEKEGEDQ